MAELQHAVRIHLFARECVYRLGAEALHWRGGDAEGQAAYGEIVKVWLMRYTGGGGETGQCVVTFKSGKSVKVRSHHYVSLGQFESRAETYVPFVRALCARVASANPQAAFVSGSTALRRVWLVVLLLLLAVLLVVGMAAYDGELAWSSGALFLVFWIGSALFAWRSLQANRLQSFDPGKPPVEGF